MPVLFRGSLGFWILSLRYEVHRIEQLLILMEEHLRVTRTEWNSTIEAKALELEDEEALTQFYDSFADEYREIDKEIPRIYRSSLIVTMFIFLETQLHHFCLRGGCAHKINGDKLNGYIHHLVKEADIEFEKDEDFGELLRLREIRNYIVHEGGIVPEDDAKIIKYAHSKGLFGDSGYSERMIYPTTEFCQEVFRSISKLLTRVNSKLYVKSGGSGSVGKP